MEQVNNSGNNQKKLVTIIAGLVVLGGAGYYGFEKYKEKHTPQQQRVVLEANVIDVKGQDVPLGLELVGQTRSPQAVDILSRVNGFLDKQVYKEGTWVKEGDILFEIDKKPFIAQLEASQAELESAEASLKTAKLTLDRVKPLAKANALSQQALDDATGAYLRAKASVDRAVANVETAKLNLSYCTIRSPIDGLASVREVALGTYIQVGATNSKLTQINQMDPMWVYFSVSEDQMLRFNQMVAKEKIQNVDLSELEVEIETSDGVIYPYVGKIGFADVLYNVNTGTRLMRAVFPNPNTELQQGQFVTARIKGMIQPNAILVPQKAVQQSQKGSYVWVVDAENKVHNRGVEVGPWNGNNWVIESGLNDGDKVVVSNVLRMSEGQTIKPVKVDQPTAQSALKPLPKNVESKEVNPLRPGNQIEEAPKLQAEAPDEGKMPEVKVDNLDKEFPKETFKKSKDEIAPVPNSLKESEQN